jgi:DNA-binding response OmpR family regulator
MEAGGMSEPHFCPSCGYSLARDEIIERDGFVLDPRGRVSFLGSPVTMTRAEAMVLHGIASCGNRTVKAEALGARISGSEDPGLVLRVFLSRVRRHLREQGFPSPVVTEPGIGYRWECLV